MIKLVQAEDDSGHIVYHAVQELYNPGFVTKAPGTDCIHRTILLLSSEGVFWSGSIFMAAFSDSSDSFFLRVDRIV